MLGLASLESLVKNQTRVDHCHCSNKHKTGQRIKESEM